MEQVYSALIPMGYNIVQYTVNEDYDKLETGTKAKSINDQSIYSPISVRKVSEFVGFLLFPALLYLRFDGIAA